MDHRKRWLVRPPGDAKRGMRLHRPPEYANTGGEAVPSRKIPDYHGRLTKSAPSAPWMGAMETMKMSRSHREHVVPSAAANLAGHNHSKFEGCGSDCPGRIFQLPWRMVPKGSWHVISPDYIEPPHPSAQLRTGNQSAYSTRVYKDFIDAAAVDLRTDEQ